MREQRKNMTQPTYTRVDEVVRDGLCHRCGVCAAFCPQHAIDFGDDAFPTIGSSCEGCGTCVRVCSGHQFDFAAVVRERHGPSASICVPGAHARCYLCSSKDEQVHLAAASGGFVTQMLIHLMRTTEIAGALLSRPSTVDTLPQAVLARTEDEIRECTNARYRLFPWGKGLRDILVSDGPFAIVGLPCQIHSFFKAVAVEPQLRQKVSLVVGLCCSMNVEPGAFRRVLQILHLNPADVARLRCRQGPWPGNVVVELLNGKTIQVFPRNANMGNQSMTFLKWTYGQRRCLQCPDPLNALADLSVGDVWARTPSGRYLCEETEDGTMVLCRTARAVSCVATMREQQQIECAQYDMSVLMASKLPLARQALSATGVRTLARKRQQSPFADYGLAGEKYSLISVARFYLQELLFLLLHTRGLRGAVLRLAFSRPGFALARVNNGRKQLIWKWQTALRQNSASKACPNAE